MGCHEGYGVGYRSWVSYLHNDRFIRINRLESLRTPVVIILYGMIGQSSDDLLDQS
jgi:hypothetical protein